MKKLSILAVLFLSLCYLSTATASDFLYGNLISDHRYWVYEGREDYRMKAFVGLAENAPTAEVYLDEAPTMDQDIIPSPIKLDYYGLSPTAGQNPIYFHSYGFDMRVSQGFPRPGPIWEGITYRFSADDTGNGIMDSVYEHHDFFLEPGTIKIIDFVSNINVINGVNPTISWDGVQIANKYRVRIYGWRNGDIEWDKELYTSPYERFNADNHYSITIPDAVTLFFGYDEIVLSIEAREAIPTDEFFPYQNRSWIYDRIPNPAIISSAQINVIKASVKLSKKDGKDRFSIAGIFELGADSDGFAISDGVLNEHVTIAFDSFTETIPAGALVQKGKNKGYVYKGQKGGITKIRIKENGRFRATANGLNLDGIDLTTPVFFSLEIGNDAGEAFIPFKVNRKGRIGRYKQNKGETDSDEDSEDSDDDVDDES